MSSDSPAVVHLPTQLLRPLSVLRAYRLRHLRVDLMAGLTVAVVAVPQVVAIAAIAGLPPSFGLYTAAVAAVVGALWGSSRFLSTGPTTALAILTLSVLQPLFEPGSDDYLAAASLMAILVGLICLAFAALGFARLVSFVSRPVLLGFTSGAALLIVLSQLRNLLRLDYSRGGRPHETIYRVATNIGEAHIPTLLFGFGTVLVILVINRLSPRVPGSLVGLFLASVAVFAVGREALGLEVVGAVDRALPTLTEFRWRLLTDTDTLRGLAAGAFAVAALGLMEAAAIAREIARRSGERLDVAQEFVGQGMANAAAGLFSGFACSGSFVRSSLNFAAGARSPMAGVACGLFVLASVFAIGPLGVYLPKAAVAGLIVVVAWRMVDWRELVHMTRASRFDAGVVAVTFLSTFVFPLDFAVLVGVVLSLTIYIHQSSMPSVEPVVPDDTFRFFSVRPGEPECPQLGVIDIHGDLFFGAARHVEDELLANREDNPGQNLLLLRMEGVERADSTGIDVLRAVVGTYRESGGDVYLMKLRDPVLELMRRSGFTEWLGEVHILEPARAVEWLFETVLDPAVCTYECELRVFGECQGLVKHPYDVRLPSFVGSGHRELNRLAVHDFEDAMAAAGRTAVLLDVREPDEYRSGHLRGARSLPLRELVEESESLPQGQPIFLVCRSGRRSARAMHWLEELGFDRVASLKGGILSWKAMGRPLQVD